MTIQHHGQAPDGGLFEVTSAMIEAGLRVIDRDFGGLRDPLLRLERDDLVCAVYAAMRKIADAD